MLSNDGRMIVIAGDVVKRRAKRNGDTPIVRTGLLIRDLVNAQKSDYYARQVGKQAVLPGRRYYHALNETKGHDTKPLIERVILIERS